MLSLSDGKNHGLIKGIKRIINKFNNIVSDIGEIKLGENIDDGTNSIMITNDETNSNPFFLQREKEKLSMINLPRLISIHNSLAITFYDHYILSYYRDESDDYNDDNGDDGDELFSAFCPPTPDTSHNWWDCGHQNNDTQIHHKGVEADRADDADAAFIYGNLPMAKVLDKNSK